MYYEKLPHLDEDYMVVEDRTDKSTHKIEAEMLRDKYVAALDIIQKQVEQIQELEVQLREAHEPPSVPVERKVTISDELTELMEMLI